MSDWDLRIGNALDLLGAMPDCSVHCCITSPPYYGLRDYGTGEWEAGDDGCDHVRRDLADNDNLSRSPASTRGGGASRKGADHLQYGIVCEKCGATRTDDQIGLEDTPEEFVEKLVAIFRQVRRVLRDDGTLWLNLGDSYARSAGIPEGRDSRKVPPGVKAKDLLGIPWTVAFALRADGWYLRSEIIWAKPNPMPSSVLDRPTNAHETIFLLAKSERYFYDTEAIRESHTMRPQARPNGHKRRRPGPLMPEHTWSGTERDEAGVDGNPAGRNKRDVWEIATRPYPEAHFATYPPQLIEPMVLAGVPRQACGVCSAPWERIVERIDPDYDGSKYGERAQAAAGGAVKGGTENSTLGSSNGRDVGRHVTKGWEKTCSCEDEGGGVGVVLDPFVGSGTTLEVAVRNGRSAIGLDLNPKNEALVRKRMAGVTPSMFDAA